MNEQVPLTTLLSWAWVAHAIEVDNAVEAVGSQHVGRLFRISLAMWANGLRLIDEEGVTVDQLQARARARCNIGGLERWGWISVGDVGPKRRDGYGSGRGVKGSTVLRPTRAGSYARRLWPRIVAEVEQRWRGRFGSEVIGSLGEALRPLAGAMPWSPPQMSAGDGFYTHVVDGPIPGAAASGKAADDIPDQHPPLVALMGQVLTAVTLEHEANAEVSLPMGADILRVIGERAVRTRDLPALSGVSKEAVAIGRPRRVLGSGGADEARGAAGPTRSRPGPQRDPGRRARPATRVLAGGEAIPGPDQPRVGGPDGGAALAPDRPASWRMAGRLLSGGPAGASGVAVLYRGLEGGRVGVSAVRARAPAHDPPVGAERRVGEARKAVRPHASGKGQSLPLGLLLLGVSGLWRRVLLAGALSGLELGTRRIYAAVGVELDTAGGARVREIGNAVRTHAPGELDRSFEVLLGGLAWRQRCGRGPGVEGGGRLVAQAGHAVRRPPATGREQAAEGGQGDGGGYTPASAGPSRRHRGHAQEGTGLLVTGR